MVQSICGKRRDAYKNQISGLVEEMETTPAESMAMISSLSEIRPPAMTGTETILQMRAIIFGIGAGRTSIRSGEACFS